MVLYAIAHLHKRPLALRHEALHLKIVRITNLTYWTFCPHSCVQIAYKRGKRAHFGSGVCVCVCVCVCVFVKKKKRER